MPDTPSPVPGLAIRIPGEITREKLEILRKADVIYLDEIRQSGLYDAIWQAFAVLLPVQTVGVMGDGRTYDYVCALRAVTSTDGMTADYYHFDHEFLSRTATRIINEVKGIKPGGLRHHFQAAGNHRVGVGSHRSLRNCVSSRATASGCSCCTQWPAPSTKWQPRMLVQNASCMRSKSPGF